MFVDLRNERKKLKADKIDLLAHVKQLCSSLQDKEQELRDFIRNYEHRIRETESTNAKVSSERERERWSLLKHAREESERSLALAAQLSARDIQLQRIQEQLQEVRVFKYFLLSFRLSFLCLQIGSPSTIWLYVRSRKPFVIRSTNTTIWNDVAYGWTIKW